MKKIFYLLLLLISIFEVANGQNAQWSFAVNNDLWNKTDRYYTNGFHARIVHPRLLLPFIRFDSTLYQTAGVHLFQDAYTPSVYNTNVYNPFDRPYAGVLAGEYFLAIQLNHRVFIEPGLLLGVIGKSALGKEVQNGVHEIIDNLQALGWEYQIKNGLLINGAINYQCALIPKPLQQFFVLASLNFGTYRSNIELGAQYQLGHRAYPSPSGMLKLRGNWSHSLLASTKIRAVAYDATLQGALGQDYTYGLPASAINRLPLISSISYTIRYKNFQFLAEQNFQSREFEGGESHRWVGLSISGYFPNFH